MTKIPTAIRGNTANRLQISAAEVVNGTRKKHCTFFGLQDFVRTPDGKPGIKFPCPNLANGQVWMRQSWMSKTLRGLVAPLFRPLDNPRDEGCDEECEWRTYGRVQV